MSNLIVYNPEHDYALADNSPHFVALRSAAQFAYDCAPFMRYLVDGESILFDAYRQEGDDFRKNFEPIAHPENITNVTPWGWDQAAVYQLRRAGVADHLLPTDAQLAKLHELAHRKTTITALKFLRETYLHPEQLPKTPQLLTNIQQVENFIKQVPDAIFKSPYSGNGRGHLYAHGICTPTLARQCAGVLRRQGGLIAEQMYNVVQDFAMEFRCHDKKTEFLGYSLFHTVHYGYGGNLLLPDEAILSVLSQYIDIQEIIQIQTLIRDFLQQYITPLYEGVAGVDMFVYQKDGTYKLHPFVEVNLRMTMGLAAHEIFRLYCHPEARGTFRIVRGKSSTHGLVKIQGTEPLQTDMQCRDGLWWSGRAVLTPVTEETGYAVVVSL